VAIELLRQKLTAHFTLIYEPSVTLTGRPQGGVDRGACALAKARYVSKALRLLPSAASRESEPADNRLSRLSF
jgi:hypothetical protein